MARKSKSKRSKKKASFASGSNIIIVAEKQVGYFQEKVNSLLSEGYEIIWSTYRHPKEEGYFCVVMISGKKKKKVSRKEMAEENISAEQEDDLDEDNSDDE